MKCPICKEKVSELESICPNCKTNLNEYEKSRSNRHIIEGTNAHKLSIMANINLIACIITSIILIVPNLLDLSAMINGISSNNSSWITIILSLGTLIIGFTVYFLLKTIGDIYYKVEK